MPDGRNEGISMSGGTIRAGALAVGRGASAHNVATDLTARGHADVAQRLEDLVRQLEAHADEVPDIEMVRDATRTVTDELAKERPNKMTLVGVLSGIAEAIGFAGGLATGVAALLDAVRAAF